jgi:hypothetical protein
MSIILFRFVVTRPRRKLLNVDIFLTESVGMMMAITDDDDAGRSTVDSSRFLMSADDDDDDDHVLTIGSSAE